MAAQSYCSDDDFISLGCRFWGNSGVGTAPKVCQANSRRYREFFGCTPFLCSLLWEMLLDQGLIVVGTHPIHLLWALLFLKQYNTEAVNAGICYCDEKTYRNWIWAFVDAISELNLVSDDHVCL